MAKIHDPVAIINDDVVPTARQQVVKPIRELMLSEMLAPEKALEDAIVNSMIDTCPIYAISDEADEDRADEFFRNILRENKLSLYDERGKAVILLKNEYGSKGKYHYEGLAVFDRHNVFFTTNLDGFEEQLEDIEKGSIQGELTKQLEDQLDVYIEDEKLREQMKKNFKKIGLGVYFEKREKVKEILKPFDFEKKEKEMLEKIISQNISLRDLGEAALSALGIGGEHNLGIAAESLKEYVLDNLQDLFKYPGFETYEELCELTASAKANYESACKIKSKKLIKAAKKRHDILESYKQAWEKATQVEDHKEILEKAEQGLERMFRYNLRSAKIEGRLFDKLESLLGKIEVADGSAITLDEKWIEKEFPKQYKTLLEKVEVNIKNYQDVSDYLEYIDKDYKRIKKQLNDSNLDKDLRKKLKKEKKVTAELLVAARTCKAFWDTKYKTTAFGMLKEIYTESPDPAKELSDIIGMWESDLEACSETIKMFENSNEENKAKIGYDSIKRKGKMYEIAIHYLKALQKRRKTEFPYEDIQNFVQTQKWIVESYDKPVTGLKNAYLSAKEYWNAKDFGKAEWLVLTPYELYLGNQKGFVASTLDYKHIKPAKTIMNSYYNPDKNLIKLFKLAAKSEN